MEYNAQHVTKLKAYLIQFMIYVGLVGFGFIQLLNQLSQRLRPIQWVDKWRFLKVNLLLCLEHLDRLYWSDPEWVASNDRVHHVAVVERLENQIDHSNGWRMATKLMHAYIHLHQWSLLPALTYLWWYHRLVQNQKGPKKRIKSIEWDINEVTEEDVRLSSVQSVVMSISMINSNSSLMDWNSLDRISCEKR